MNNDDFKVVSQNKKAWHDYFVETSYEAGIVLSGTEIKSLRLGRVALKDSYAMFKSGELYLCNMHISPYDFGNRFNLDPLRDRKLLLHKIELNKLTGFIREKGLALVPLKLYFKRSKLKVQIGVCKGKKLYDKREDIAKKDAQRAIERSLKGN